jgi:HSP20 family protein
MLLTTYSPFEKQIDEFFKDVLNGSSTRAQTWVPRCDVYEDANGFSVTAAIPAVDPKEVNITVEHGILTLSGERKWHADAEGRHYAVREIPGGTFSRSFRLPENVDTEKVSAHYKNGMLTIDLPKKEEAKPHRIQIEVK